MKKNKCNFALLGSVVWTYIKDDTYNFSILTPEITWRNEKLPNIANFTISWHRSTAWEEARIEFIVRCVYLYRLWKSVLFLLRVFFFNFFCSLSTRFIRVQSHNDWCFLWRFNSMLCLSLRFDTFYVCTEQSRKGTHNYAFIVRVIGLLVIYHWLAKEIISRTCHFSFSEVIHY